MLSLAAYGAVALAFAAGSFVLARSLVDRSLGERESALPLAIFRILYGCVLLAEVGQLFYYRQLVADPVPFLEPGELRLSYVLVAWMAAIVCLILGLFTRTAAVVNYVITLVSLSVFRDFEYHVDYVMTGVNLLFVVSPVERVLSIDALRRPRPETVSPLYGRLFIAVGIVAVYLDSIFYKLASPMWMAGLGVWLPASLPAVAWLDFSPLLDVEWLVRGTGFLTLAFEASFPFLVWFRRARLPLCAVGLGLHVGITLVFPIPWFGLAMIALYVFLLPPEWLERARDWLVTRSAPRPARSAGEEAPRPAGDEAPRPAWLRPAWIGFACTLLLLQGVASSQSPGIRRVGEMVGLGTAQDLAAPLAWRITRDLAAPFTGVTRHGVFMDQHFRGYNHMVSVSLVEADGSERPLPLYDARGLPGAGNTGRVWVYWTFRAVGHAPSPERLSRGIERMTAFWAGRWGVDLADARFVVRMREIDSPSGWEKGFLRRQLSRPWREIGRARWREGRFEASLAGLQTGAGELAEHRGWRSR